MFPYTEKCNESESDIQNNNLLYKIHPKCQNMFPNKIFEHFEKTKSKGKKENIYTRIFGPPKADHAVTVEKDRNRIQGYKYVTKVK